jgi:hypothetical protein
MCGFDTVSPIWSCGPFAGKKDCVVHFLPIEDSEYHKKELVKYQEYVKSFFEVKIETKDLVGQKHHYPVFIQNEKADVSEILSFQDWLQIGSPEKFNSYERLNPNEKH